MASDDDAIEASEAAVAALHDVELGVEWLRRAHGDLLAFHHEVGHAMDHLADAESALRECGRTDLADALRDKFLPRGVLEDDRWSYEVVEGYEADFLEPLVDFECEARERIADGRRHVAERQQEREWRRRARDR